MFHIDATFEDIRLIASSEEGTDYNVVISDALTGKQTTLVLTPAELSYILAVNLNPEGKIFLNVEHAGDSIRGKVARLPQELRPIP